MCTLEKLFSSDNCFNALETTLIISSVLVESVITTLGPLAGVQGEHKIKRGFCPIETFSAHWIKDIRFKEAIDDFLSRERAHILEYNQDRKSRLPFRKEVISDLYEKI